MVREDELRRRKVDKEQELQITKSAYKVIEEESKKYEYNNRHQYETGGILIGALKKQIVVKASKPGERATLGCTHYTNDSYHDNEILKEAIDEFKGRIKLVGYWHKHPDSMSRPSTIDLHTAQHIVERNESTDKRPVFFIITNVVKDEVKLYGYSLKRGQKEFSCVTVRIIEDDSEEVQNALCHEPVIIQSRKMDFWNDLDFQSYLTKVGNKRIKEEVNELQSNGYVVKVFMKEQLLLVIRMEKTTLLCVLPPEYPLNPPRLFENHAKEKAEIQYCVRFWNSTCRIVDIIRSFEVVKTAKRRNNESDHFETNHGLLKFFQKIREAVKSIWLHKKN